jgi:hypothetical protein
VGGEQVTARIFAGAAARLRENGVLAVVAPLFNIHHLRAKLLTWWATGQPQYKDPSPFEGLATSTMPSAAVHVYHSEEIDFEYFATTYAEGRVATWEDVKSLRQVQPCYYTPPLSL